MNYSQIFTLILKKRVLKHVLFWLINIGIIVVPMEIYIGVDELLHYLPRLIVVFVYLIER